MDNTIQGLLYDKLLDLIGKIYKLHSDFSTEFSILKDVQLINLKKKQIRDVTSVSDETELFTINKSFYQLIMGYTERLKKLTYDIELEYDFIEFDLRLRVKQPDSIVNKLKYYRVGKPEQGKIDLNKCLNDLLGFRIIFKQFDHNDEYFKNICEKISQMYSNRVRIRDSSKFNYKATHIYFYGETNKYFPWELQIWDPDNLTTNDKSHTLHKQEYTKWAEIYKNSSEIS